MHTRHPPSPSSVADTLFTPESSHSWSGVPVKATDDLLIGTTLLDTYVVDRVLGEGGMGRIYEAHHARLEGKRFAVKVLRPELISNPQIRARFEREVETVAKISHPGVLSIVDVGSTPRGWPYMVCEHLEGLDLLAYLRRFGSLPSDEAVRLGRRIAQALEATHAQGVIHRDVKPSNVFLIGTFGLLDPEWHHVKLIDFGLSRFTARDDQLTKTGIVMGTPAYMSPEQALGSRTDHLTDVYGVGAILYAAATGVPPYREDTQQQTLLAVMNREPERPSALNPAISEELEVVIQRAMARRPGERYPSMKALGAALAQLELASASRLAGAHDDGVREVRSRLLWLGGSAALMLVGGFVSAASGVIALWGESFRLTLTERVLLSILLALLAVLLMLSLRRFEQSAWGNTAKLSYWVPRLRAPLVAACAAYGIASFALRFADEVIAGFAWSGLLGTAPGSAWPGWSFLLVVVALLAAVGASIRQRWWQPHHRLRRWVFGPVLNTSLLLASLALAHFGFGLRNAGRGAEPALEPPAARAAGLLSNAPAASARRRPLVASVTATDASAPHPEPSDAGLDARSAASTLMPTPTGGAREADSATSADPLTQTIAALSPEASLLAPVHSSAAARVREPQELERLSRLYPRDPEVWKALALARARRSASLGDAVHALGRLLSLAPERAQDPDVRRILTQAASREGDASRAAFAAMTRGMGSAGPDLLYELVLSQPALAERAKERLSRPSVRELFSPELAIAYDLRFAPSCAARLDLLEHADRWGDQRSLDVLSALISKPPQCGRRGQPPCRARCHRQAARLERSIQTISRRLRGPAARGN